MLRIPNHCSKNTKLLFKEYQTIVQRIPKQCSKKTKAVLGEDLQVFRRLAMDREKVFSTRSKFSVFLRRLEDRRHPLQNIKEAYVAVLFWCGQTWKPFPSKWRGNICSFKGTVSWDELFLEDYNIKSVFTVYALMVYEVFYAFLWKNELQSCCLLLLNCKLILTILSVIHFRDPLAGQFWKCSQKTACVS